MPRNEDYNDKFMNLCDWNFSDANTINLCNLGDNNTQNDGLENLQSRQNYIELDPAKAVSYTHLLICDSMCDIPEEIVNKEFVEMIPLTINIDGKEYKDGVDFTKEQFYDILKKCDNLPKTSQVTYVDFKNIFEKYTKEGYDVICCLLYTSLRDYLKCK